MVIYLFSQLHKSQHMRSYCCWPRKISYGWNYFLFTGTTAGLYPLLVTLVMLSHVAPQQHTQISKTKMEIRLLPLKTRRPQYAILSELYHFLLLLEVSRLTGSHSGVVHLWYPFSIHSQVLLFGIAELQRPKKRTHEQRHRSRSVNRMIQQRWTLSRLKAHSSKKCYLHRLQMKSICTLKSPTTLSRFHPWLAKAEAVLCWTTPAMLSVAVLAEALPTGPPPLLNNVTHLTVLLKTQAWRGHITWANERLHWTSFGSRGKKGASRRR